MSGVWLLYEDKHKNHGSFENGIEERSYIFFMELGYLYLIRLSSALQTFLTDDIAHVLIALLFYGIIIAFVIIEQY